MRRSDSLVSREILKWIVLSQYIPRILRIYPLYKEVTKASGTVAETKWIGAAFNLFLYMLHSHVSLFSCSHCYFYFIFCDEATKKVVTIVMHL